jgi:hypothetical protein
MIVQGVALTGVTVFDLGYVTSGLMYYADVGRSVHGSGTSINNISGSGIGSGCRCDRVPLALVVISHSTAVKRLNTMLSLFIMR